MSGGIGGSCASLSGWESAATRGVSGTPDSSRVAPTRGAVTATERFGPRTERVKVSRSATRSRPLYLAFTHFFERRSASHPDEQRVEFIFVSVIAVLTAGRFATRSVAPDSKCRRPERSGVLLSFAANALAARRHFGIGRGLRYSRRFRIDRA